MSCHGCARSFGFLTKEYGCQKCGFSFCSKCLVNKVCKSCSTKAVVTSLPPPVPVQSASMDSQKKLDKQEAVKKSSVTVHSAPDQRLANLKRGLSAEDQELVDRLAKLRSEVRDIKGVPSQDEIEERLAKLKGLDPKVYKQPAFSPAVAKLAVDSATDLLNQMSEEVAIDSQSDLPKESTVPPTQPEDDDLEALLRKEAAVVEAEAKLALENLKKDEEIQERLEKLRLDRGSRQQVPEASERDADEVLDSEDEDKQVRAIIDRALAETAMDLSEDEEVDVAKDDELPWCELCNEDAQLRCVDCDGDLYCRRCWRETHKEPDLKQHRIKDYTA